MINAVVLISGSGSNLQAIIDQVEHDDLPLNISLVISNNENAYGLERAKSAGINATYLDHRKFASRLDFDRALINEIDLINPELLILAGFMRILTSEFVHHYEQRLLNIHPSLLPKYPGNNTHQRAIDAKDQWHGVSIHYVVPEVDAGPIILQGRIKIEEDESAEALSQRIHKIEHKLYPLAIRWYAEGRLSIFEDEVLLDGETHSDQLQSFDL